MQATKQRDTRPELALRSALHRHGLRFRVHRVPVSGFRRRADIIFPRDKVAVFLDGCFWHGCPEHMTWPVANAQWWRKKIEGNRLRDRGTDKVLQSAGWSVLRVWEHEDAEIAARRIAGLVRKQRKATHSARTSSASG